MSALGLKIMVFHFCSKENTIQKYDHNIPKETCGHFSQCRDVGDTISQSVCPANSAFKIKMGFDFSDQSEVHLSSAINLLCNVY